MTAGGRAGCYRVERGQGLWVAGPARVAVEEGCVLGSGRSLCSGEEALVRGARGYTFYAVEGAARLCVHGGSSSEARVVSRGLETVEGWLRLLDELEAVNAGRIAVVGPPESGKSTFTAWAANRLGLGIVEADVGQNELGLPACVSYAPPPGGGLLVLQDLQGSPSVGCVFVGHVSAERVADLVVAAVLEAGRRLQGKGFVVDTDGFVYGRGAAYKAALATALQPDAVVVLGSPWLATQLRGRGLTVYEAPPPPLPRERSRADRRAFRSRQWARLFAASKPAPLEGVQLLGLCPHALDGEDVVYRCPGTGELREARHSRRGLRPGWEKGLLAALLSPSGDRLLLVERLDPKTGRVVARVAGGPAFPRGTGLALGWVKLHTPGFEEEHLPPLPSGSLPPGRGGGRRSR